MTQENLHKALAKRPQDRRTWRCPEEILIAAYADGGLSGRDRDRLERHLAGCSYCLGQVADLARLQDSEPPADVPPSVLARARELVLSKAPLWRPAWRWGAIGVTACIAVLATVSVQQPAMKFVAPVESVRKAPERAAFPALLAPREGATVARDAIEVRWTPVERAMFYDLHLLSADGDLIWEGRADGIQARLPASIRVSPGQKYYVSVAAWLPDGKSLKSSLVQFQIEGGR